MYIRPRAVTSQLNKRAGRLYGNGVSRASLLVVQVGLVNRYVYVAHYVYVKRALYALNGCAYNCAYAHLPKYIYFRQISVQLY